MFEKQKHGGALDRRRSFQDKNRRVREIKQVSSFKYLGSVISDDGRCLVDVKTGIALSGDAVNRRKQLWQVD